MLFGIVVLAFPMTIIISKFQVGYSRFSIDSGYDYMQGRYFNAVDAESNILEFFRLIFTVFCIA